ncbi:MAG: beta-mannosidase [Limisphaerales bacterium]
MLRHEISNHWVFREDAKDQFHPARVPGCVHTDLMRNGLIPDPFFGTNEQELQWIGEQDWIYQTTFDLPEDFLKQTNVELVFRGLDTYAAVTLNGSSILTANNMFREWRIPCKPLLQEKGNALVVRFRNVFAETLPKYQSAPYRLHAFGTNDQADVKLAMYSRKAQFHYGWDWGPRLITCGIWRPVLIEAWSGLRIKSVFVQQQKVSAAGADIISVLEVLSDAPQRARISVKMDSIQLNAEEHPLQQGLNRITVKGHLDKPALWWTNGLGGQPLYHYLAQVEAAGVKAVDDYSARIGVRSLEIVRDRDASGTSLYVRLNGVPVFMKGANYVPLDNFQNRVTRDRYEYILRSAVEAHMNMLRIWGGGIYEEDIFYDLCDQHGLLIWHDMQFACATYPVDEAFRQNVRQEIIENITRLRNHASIALYCGNNENEVCWHLAWKKLCSPEIKARHEQGIRTLYHETVGQAVRETDPTRYYHPTSPNAGFADIPYGEGDIHYWGVWHGKEPFEKYPDNIGRFVSEYGFQSYPELSTVKKFAGPKDRELHSPVMLAHQRCMADERKDKEYGNRLIQTYMDQWYRKPKDFEAYLYVSQVMQADGVRLGMEAHRRAMPCCMGSLYWQINDCWPVASWSSIDYFGRWKALHYSARRTFAPVVISPVMKENETQFYIVSDRLDPLDAVLEIVVLDFGGKEVSRRTQPVAVAANTSGLHLTLTREQLTRGQDEAQLVIVSRLKEEKGIIAEDLRCFCLPKDLKLSPPQITPGITKSKDGYSIELSCRSFARNVMLACGDDEGFFSDNYFDLLPGETKLVNYRTSLDEETMKQQLTTTSLMDSYD